MRIRSEGVQVWRAGGLVGWIEGEEGGGSTHCDVVCWFEGAVLFGFDGCPVKVWEWFDVNWFCIFPLGDHWG